MAIQYLHAYSMDRAHKSICYTNLDKRDWYIFICILTQETRVRGLTCSASARHGMLGRGTVV